MSEPSNPVEAYGTFGYDKMSLDELNDERMRLSAQLRELSEKKRSFGDNVKMGDTCRRIMVQQFYARQLADET